MNLPEAIGRVVLLRQAAHPFLAEYFRKLRLEPADGQAVPIDLPMNCGGRTMINVYLHAEKSTGSDVVRYLRLQDHWGEYVVDLREKRLLQTTASQFGGSQPPPDDLNVVKALPSKYLGRFDGRKKPLRFLSAKEALFEEIERAH